MLSPLFPFFLNAPATTEIYTLSLHDALPISTMTFSSSSRYFCFSSSLRSRGTGALRIDRKSTRLNSSHSQISYAVFCLKKKNQHRAFYLPVEQLRDWVLSWLVARRAGLTAMV